MRSFLIVVLLILPGTLWAQNTMTQMQRIYAKAEIVSIDQEEFIGPDNRRHSERVVSIRILDGPLKGERRKARFGGEDDMPYDMRYREGDKVFVGIAPEGLEGTAEYISLYDFDNTLALSLLLLLMLGALLYVGRLKGLGSLLALLITVLLVFTLLIPMTLKGHSPLPLAILISILSISITMPVIAGFRKKTVAAILGASGGVTLAALLAVLFGHVMHLSGVVTNDMLTVFYLSDVTIDLRGLAISGMIIAALGAIMDISISIASSAAEIHQANPDIDTARAFNSVLTIGRDILGSMVNTLILAYTGSSLSMVLLIAMKLQPGMPLAMVLNYNPVLSELVKSAVGSIGMFLAIPLTAWIAVKLYFRK